jgi:hypothetical protein
MMKIICHVIIKQPILFDSRSKKLLHFSNNKNCLGSFQVLWNKNCNTKNEKKIMKILIKNIYQKNNQKRGKN